jgi:prepilin-type N-terminal cleavage/methylation domain-containing protein
MDYRARSNQDGFTIVELIVVLGIFALFAGLSSAAYTSTASQSNLEVAALSTVEAVRHAQSNAREVQGDAPWGVRILSNRVVVYRGESYASRDTGFDEEFALPRGVTVGGLPEIAFQKVTGVTGDTGTVTLENKQGTKNISINEKGTLTY